MLYVASTLALIYSYMSHVPVYGAYTASIYGRNDIKASGIWGVFSSSSANCKMGPRAS